MIKYEETENGVKDRETGASIPNAPGNRHWREYQEWLAEGNTPVPLRPSQHHRLDEADPQNPVWVEDVTAREKADALQFMEQSDKEQARAVDDIIAILPNKNRLPQAVLDRFNAREAARQKVRE